MTIVFALALLAVACGSDINDDSAEQPVGSTATPPASTNDPILGAGPYPVATVDFAVTNSQTGEAIAMYTLSCLGDTATLTGDWSPTDNADEIGNVAADEMCRKLGEDAVRDRLINGVPADQICTEIYGSADVADVTGDFSGQTVATTFDRSNGCGIDDWDTLMAGLLPLATNP